MSHLRPQLAVFLSWCGLTDEEYTHGFVPRLGRDVQVEWEDDYPEWEALNGAFAVELDAIAKGGSGAIIHDLALAIAIDADGGSLFDAACRQLPPDVFKRVVEQLLEKHRPDVRQLVAFGLSKEHVAAMKDMFAGQVVREGEPTVAKAFLDRLLEVDVLKAVDIAKRTVAHHDMDVRRASLDILHAHDREAFLVAVKAVPFPGYGSSG